MSGLNIAIAAGEINVEQGEQQRAIINQLLGRLPAQAAFRLHGHLERFHWHASEQEVNAAYHATPNSNPAFFVPAFYYDGSIHVSGNTTPIDHAHEFAHAVDGPFDEITRAHEWEEAYRLEMGRLSDDAYPTTNAAEWWATLVAVALTRPDVWDKVRRRVPRSARIIGRYFDG